MINLLHKKCVVCEGGEPPLTDTHIKDLSPQVPDWQVEREGHHPVLVRTFTFKDFVESIDFVNRVRDVAESEGHHPDLSIHWNKVRVSNWTHATGGLHENDFILAAKIDQIAAH